MYLFKKPKPAVSTAFAHFIRHADSQTKKRVYIQVMQRASKRQQDVIDAASGAPQPAR